MPISHLLGESFYHSAEQFDNSVNNLTVLANSLVISNPNNSSNSGQKFVLIDTDAGTEDAWALFMMIAAAKKDPSNFKIVGITTVYGNTTVENVINNAARVLDTVEEYNIPIFKGMNSSLVGKYTHSPTTTPYNGHDGFGDAKLPPIGQPTPKVGSEHAVDAIIKFAEAYPGKLTILTLGPLTNLAMAIKLRPDLKNLVKEIYILGGNVEGLGNITVSSEFNFFVDPEAASVVLDNFSPCPISILPWESQTKFGMFPHTWRMNVIGNMRTKQVSLLNKIEANILSTYQDNWMVGDAILAACLINPNVIKQSAEFHTTVELGSGLTRGMMIVDKSYLQQKQSNAKIVQEIDQELYESMLVWAAGGPEPLKN